MSQKAFRVAIPRAPERVDQTMQTPRENLLSCLRHHPPEWVPVTCHVDAYNQPDRRGMDAALAEALGDIRGSDESTIILSRYLGLDIMDKFRMPLQSVSRKVTAEDHREGDVYTAVWHTPTGDLRRVLRLSPSTGLWYTQEHMVKTKSDLVKLAAVYEDQEWEIDPVVAEELKERRELIGEDGIITLTMPGTPLGQMVRILSGVETLAYLWADARSELHQVFGVMADSFERQFRLALQLPGVDAMLAIDDTSTTAISPAMFEEYCLSYTDRIADVCHDADTLYLHHSCGLIRDLLPLYRQTRMDAVHAFSMPPLGNVTIAEGKAALGSRIAIVAEVVQLFDDMRDRAKTAASLESMFAEAGEENTAFWIVCDPEKDMEETAWLAEQCRRLSGKPPPAPTGTEVQAEG